ncbi:hypothetical protein ABZ949_02655 [Micromonospora tulbaghiae]|uniref:hypothetical protein n=1 Tax=Micromonospora tulbaghiae TaxID=479978 RepID=UPI0033CEED58
MTAAVLAPAPTATAASDWPPLAQDVWADRRNTEWVADVYDLGDGTGCQMVALDGSGRRATPEFLAEVAGPLRLVAAGWDRNRQAVTV